METISRTEAKAAALPRYFTGKPCKHGHIAERYTKIRACVECIRLHNAKYREDHLIERREYTARWKAENGMNSTAYYRRNPERYRSTRRKYYHRHLDKERERLRVYSRLNRPGRVIREARRRARARAAGGDFTTADIEKLMKQQRGRCANCLTSLKSGYHIDHVMPVSLSGSNDPRNLQLLCPSCNRRKYNKHPAEWAAENGRLL